MGQSLSCIEAGGKTSRLDLLSKREPVLAHGGRLEDGLRLVVPNADLLSKERFRMANKYLVSASTTGIAACDGPAG
jgi:hypothetical protein